MILIAWLLCVAVAGALLYVGLNAIAGLRDACATTTPAPAPTPTPTVFTILPPGPRNQPNGNGRDHDRAGITSEPSISAAVGAQHAAPAAPPHQVERHPKSRKPGQHC